MRKKYKVFDFHMYEHKELEVYLTRMAHEGWRLRKVFSICFCELLQFEKSEPAGVTYRVDYTYDLMVDRKEQNAEAKERYLDFMAEYGYEHICDLEALSIFSTDDKTVIPLQEESEITHRAIRKGVIRRDIIGHLIFPFMLFQSAYVEYNGLLPSMKHINLLAQPTFMLVIRFILFVYILLSLCYVLPSFVWLIRERSHSSIRSIRIFSMVEGWTYIVCICLILLSLASMNLYVFLLCAIILFAFWAWFHIGHKETNVLDELLILLVIIFVVAMSYLLDYLRDFDDGPVFQPYFTSADTAFPTKSLEQSCERIENPLVIRDRYQEGVVIEEDHSDEYFWYEDYRIKDTLLQKQAIEYLKSYYETKHVRKAYDVDVYQGDGVLLYQLGNRILMLPEQAGVKDSIIYDLLKEGA